MNAGTHHDHAPGSDLETVQAHVSDLAWAEQELTGFAQVELAPGQTAKRCCTSRVLAGHGRTDVDGRRVVEPGEFEYHVGPSFGASSSRWLVPAPSMVLIHPRVRPAHPTDRDRHGRARGYS